MNNIMKAINIVFITIFIFIIFYSAITNMHSVRTVANKLKENNDDWHQILQAFDKDYTDALKQKNDLITLNGGIARILGKHKLNNVIKLSNGNLVHEVFMGRIDNIESGVSNIIKFNDYLEHIKIPFLYVQAPSTIPHDDVGLSGNGINLSIDKILKDLNVSGANTLDLRKKMMDQNINFTNAFFKTDHHWTSKTAFWAYNEVLDEINTITNIDFNDAYRDIANYDIKVYENYFLGSLGKRVGSSYAGIDNFSLITPKFETQFNLIDPRQNIVRHGTFKDILELQFLNDKDIDFFLHDPYAVYTIPTYNIFQNLLVNNNKKIMIISDSYAFPLSRFISTQFAEVHHICLLWEPYVDEEYLFELINEVNPSIIIMLYATPTLYNEKAFGVNPNGIQDSNI